MLIPSTITNISNYFEIIFPYITIFLYYNINILKKLTILNIIRKY